MLKKIAIAAAAVTFLAGCTTDPYTGEQKMSNTAGGAGIGAAVGALGGLMVGGSSTAQRNAVLSGGAIGNYMDRQENELRAQLQGTGVSVTRNGDRIILNMPSSITFNTDQDVVMPQFYPTLTSVAIVLRKFDKTLVDIKGHTDSTGSASHNQNLSQRRAASVGNYLSGQGIDGRRFAIMGFGATQPVASNATPDGRAQNRRVEIEISPLKGV